MATSKASKASDSDQQSGKLQQQSVRFADEDWEALEAMAKAERKQTGSTITASGVLRRIVRREIKRAGHGARTRAPIVV
jgi:hypothetical protein